MAHSLKNISNRYLKEKIINKLSKREGLNIYNLCAVGWFCLGLFNLTIAQHASLDESYHTIYIVNIRWHTGIIIKTSGIPSELKSDINYFIDKRFIDIGWGDADFYQHPNFDIDLAIKALFVPTESVLRIEGFNLAIDEYIRKSDFCVKLGLPDSSFKKLCKFIRNSFMRDNGGKLIISSEKGLGSIKFYYSKFKYHLLNTCNTWIAKALQAADYDINPHGILTVQQIFKEVRKFGQVIKLN